MNKIRICYYIKFFVFVILLHSGYANNFRENNIPQFSKLKKSVVYIEVFSREKIGKKYTFIKKAYGSGTILTKNGYIVTNYHVVNHGNYFNIMLADGKKCKLEKIKHKFIYLADPETDIAVLKLKVDEFEYEPVKLANSSRIEEGDNVYAIGNPYGLIASITSGIISSKSRSDIGFTQIEDFIQTDVPINPGSSGGPLININGEVVGINTAIRTVSGGYQGISFAIPSNMVKFIFVELIKYGRVRRGWIGILIQNSNGSIIEEIQGVKVISIIKNSPAHYAGIKNGDIISHIDGQKILSRGNFLKIIKNKAIGTKLVFTLKRSGQKRRVDIILHEKKYHKKLEKFFKRFFRIYGIALEINSMGEQLIVTSVSPLKMYLHENNVLDGDILYSINGKKISDPVDFIKILKYFKYKVKTLKVIRNSNQFLIKINKE